MKLEVEMYVRTNSGIRKCERVDRDGTYKFNDEIYNKYGDAFVWIDEDDLERYISKSSHNIIDLIEVGDYVNGLRVHGITDYGLEVYMFGDAKEILEENEIKSIVTREQFESMSYKVGE